MKHELFTSTDQVADFIRPIPNWSNYYADAEGNIYSTKVGLRMMRPRVISSGYEVVDLYDVHGRRTTVHVHHLVAAAFHGPRPAGMLVCHGPDHSKTNNRATNLSYKSAKANVADAREAGQLGRTGGKKLNPAKVREIRALAATTSNAEIARKMGVGLDCIRYVLEGRTWCWVE